MSAIRIIVSSGGASITIEVPTEAAVAPQEMQIGFADFGHMVERAAQRRHAFPVAEKAVTSNTPTAPGNTRFKQMYDAAVSKAPRDTGVQAKEVTPGELQCPDEIAPNEKGYMLLGERISRAMERRAAAGQPPLMLREVGQAAIDRRDFVMMLDNRKRAGLATAQKIARLFGETVEDFLAVPVTAQDAPEETAPIETSEEPTIIPINDPVEEPTREPYDAVTFGAAPEAKKVTEPEQSDKPLPKDKSQKLKKPRHETRDISRQLNVWLTERGINAFVLCRLSGVSNGEISKFKRGLQKPCMATIARLAKAFDVTTEEFLAGPKGEFMTADATEPEPSLPVLNVEPPAGMTILEQWMEAKGKSAQDIANATGMDVSMVRMMVRGEREIGMHTTATLAKIFRIPPQRFSAGPKKEDYYNPEFSGAAIQPFATGNIGEGERA